MKAPVVTENGKGEKFILFFGAQRTNGVCSNFYKASFKVDGIEFSCVEQFMMYNKAITFGDTPTAQEVLKEVDPKVMKSWGRKVKNFDCEVWDKARYDVVKRGVTEKFTQNPELADWMKKVECDYFVECSPYDAIWGVKLPLSSPDAVNPDAWKGTNLLGRILKEVHDEICNA